MAKLNCSMDSSGGASASTNVLMFPERNKGRKRASRSIESMGLVAMMMAEREKKGVGSNVERLDGLAHCLPSKSTELLFATLIWTVLTTDQRDGILSQLRYRAYGADPDLDAVKLHNMLTGRRSATMRTGFNTPE